MHSRVFQITKQQIGEDEFATAFNFDYEEYSDFADYFDDERVDIESDLKWFDSCFNEIFERNGRELTLLSLDNFISEWHSGIKRVVANIDFKNWLTLYRLRSCVKKTHLDCDFVVCPDYGGLESFGDYVMYLYANHAPGDKFYIGGIIDYHF